jgi:Penicillin-insensitive murein endopeptidase/LysM domain
MTKSDDERHRRTLLWVALSLSLPAASLGAADAPTTPRGPSSSRARAERASDEAPVDGLGASASSPAPRLPTPDSLGLRLLVQLDPSVLGPLSIGSPDAGLLFNPQPMPEGRLWSIRNPVETFGTTETIGFIVKAIETVDTEFPGSPRVIIGDISRRDGGRLDRHASHQVGRDADIGFYYRTGEADDFRRPRRNELDTSRTWALVRAFITETDVERIFLDRSIQRLLYSRALEIGEDRDWLDGVFGRRTGGRDAIIQHVRRHYDHMHVRFYNRRAQEWGRRAYPLLVEAGLVPGPTLSHRARPGETLSHLSRRYGTSSTAIRAANGLRGSVIRAGRKYLIPVRRIPGGSEPLVIPPRRLPPPVDARRAGE